MKLFSFLMNDEKLTAENVGKYSDGTPAIRVYDEDGMPWVTLTVCVEGTKLEHGEVLVKTWSENEPTYKRLVELGRLQPTGRSVPAGYVKAEVCRLVLP